MKKTRSLNFRLVLSTSLSFFMLILMMVVGAFGVYSVNVHKIINEQMILSSKEKIGNYETYFQSIVSLSSRIQTELSNIDIIDKKNDVNYLLDDIILLKEEVNSVSLYNLDGEHIISNSDFVSLNNIKEEEWFKSTLDSPLIDVFSKVSFESDGYAFNMSKVIDYNNLQNQAVLQISCNFNSIVNLIEEVNLGENGRVSIYNKNYEIIYTSKDLTNIEINTLKGIVLGTTSTTIDNDSFLVFASSINKTSWRVAIFINNSNINASVNTFSLIIVICATFIYLLFLIVILLLGNNLTKPIRNLSAQMNSIKNLSIKSDSIKIDDSFEEIEDLTQSYKLLISKINSLTTEIINEKEEQKKIELRALQNQINPHFLYNTLDSIIYLIDQEENAKAQKMIVALSKFFRISISRGKNVISIQKEIEHVTNYLLIQKIRFGNTFSYEINISKNILKYSINKLVLQPIVENAINHGLKENEGIGKILINGYEKNNLIHLEVIDNGYGITKEKADEIRKSFFEDISTVGVGIKNVYQRLKVYYGNEANILIDSELDDYSKITIVIPKKELNENE